MKKTYKIISVFLVSIITTTLGIGFYFKNSLFIVYSVYQELKDANESVETLAQLTDYYTTQTMDMKNIKFKESESKNVYLDIYKSDIKDKPSPVVLYIHGGSWIYGDNGIPIGLEPIVNAFNKRGYTLISVSYELLKENTPIENPIKDVKDSIRWIYKNKEKYNLDTSNIGILGISSGAHLALMAAYSKDNEFKGDMNLAGYPSEVNYIIDVFGPTDLNTLNISSVEKEYKEMLERILKNTDILNEYSPINYINSSSPKTLIIHSKNDEIVPYKNASNLYNSLKSHKVKTKLLTLDSGTHYFSGYKQFEIMALIFEVLKFLDINYKW